MQKPFLHFLPSVLVWVALLLAIPIVSASTPLEDAQVLLNHEQRLYGVQMPIPALAVGQHQRFKLQHNYTHAAHVDGDRLYVVSQNRSDHPVIDLLALDDRAFLEVYQLPELALIAKTELRTKDVALITSGDGVVYILEREGLVHALSSKDFTPLRTFHLDNIPESSRFKVQGQKFFVLGSDGVVRIHDLDKSSLVGVIDTRHDYPERFLSLEPDQRQDTVWDLLAHEDTIYVATSHGAIKRYDRQTLAFLGQDVFDEGGDRLFPVRALAISDTHNLLFGLWHIGLGEIDLKSGEWRWLLHTGQVPVFHGVDKLLSFDHTVVISPMASDRLHFLFPPRGGGFHEEVLTPQAGDIVALFRYEQMLIAVTEYGMLHLWKMIDEEASFYLQSKQTP